MATNYYDGKDIAPIKQKLKQDGFEVATLDSEIKFADLKKDSNGLVPVVVQDYYNNEVLMVAYMNADTLNQTIESGRATFWSRSRREVWVKGDTSGNYMYVKEIRVDCDGDCPVYDVKFFKVVQNLFQRKTQRIKKKND